MEAFWTSAVAVVGTLLGSVITHVFQRQSNRRSELFTREESLRKERIDTYSSFAAAVAEYRRGQGDRWYRKVEDPDGAPFRAAREEGHRLRTAARQALYRVELLTGDPDVLAAAERAYKSTQQMSNAADQSEHDARDRAAKEAIQQFVACASQLVR
ncbi:hypothetical protein [Prauserella cavernicola]|uniref:Uncharacterized protein n=1 Tax=Prauserella cavernicola TaxID=2800127 RepID=A0A934QV29_9PSEU|nr:hypothetical protein [Prauserella cavernicola]MBK1786903.1 hypothetical protein [Prauserella cavernicola]